MVVDLWGAKNRRTHTVTHGDPARDAEVIPAAMATADLDCEYIGFMT